MKQSVLLTGFLLLAPACAAAQVTVNPAALQQLAGVIPPPEPIAAAVPAPSHPHAPAARPRWRKPQGGELDARRAPEPHPHPTPQPTPVQQATARLVPPVPPKPAPPPQKPLAPVTLTFAPGSAALPANATAALQPYCASKNMIAIDGRAPTDPTDLSAAMRLSLARAMAVQAALTACGVPVQKILPRALGDVPGRNENEILVGIGIQ